MSDEVACLVCKNKLEVSEENVGRTVECDECRSTFVVHKRVGRLTLDYPEFSEEDSSIRDTP